MRYSTLFVLAAAAAPAIALPVTRFDARRDPGSGILDQFPDSPNHVPHTSASASASTSTPAFNKRNRIQEYEILSRDDKDNDLKHILAQFPPVPTHSPKAPSTATTAQNPKKHQRTPDQSSKTGSQDAPANKRPKQRREYMVEDWLLAQNHADDGLLVSSGLDDLE